MEIQEQIETRLPATCLPRVRQSFSVILNAIGLVAVLGAAWLLPGMLEVLLLASV